MTEYEQEKQDRLDDKFDDEMMNAPRYTDEEIEEMLDYLQAQRETDFYREGRFIK